MEDAVERNGVGEMEERDGAEKEEKRGEGSPEGKERERGFLVFFSL